MQVEILVEFNDVRQRYYLGHVYELDAVEALHWIEKGYAMEISPAAEMEPDTATFQAGPEQAIKPRGRPRKRP